MRAGDKLIIRARWVSGAWPWCPRDCRGHGTAHVHAVVVVMHPDRTVQRVPIVASLEFFDHSLARGEFEIRYSWIGRVQSLWKRRRRPALP